MKKFARSLIYMICVIIFMISLFYSWAYYRFSEATINDKSFLICGDSHTECAINPNLMHDASNYSKSAEDLFCTYKKLQYLYSHSSCTIDTVIIGFSFHNIMEDHTSLTNIQIVNTYYYLLDNQECKRHYNINKYSIFFNGYDPLKEFYVQTKGFSIEQMDCFGGYLDLDCTDLSSGQLDTVITKHFKSHKFKDMDILNKIIDLTLSHKTNLIILTTPLSKDYRENIPSYVKKRFYSILQKKSNYNNVDFIDCSTLEIPAKFFLNHDHLNHSGASYFDYVLNQKIKLLRYE